MKNKIKIVTVLIYLVLAVIASTYCVFDNLEAISNTESDQSSPSIKLVYNGQSKIFYPNSYKVKSNIFTHIAQKHKYGRSNIYSEQVKYLKLIISQGWSCQTAFKFLFTGLDNDIERWLILNVDTAPQNAKLIFQPTFATKFAIIREKLGKRADRERLYCDIFSEYINSSHINIKVNTLPINAEITAEKLKEETFLRSRFSTDYSSSSEARKHNIRLALKRLDGTIIPHGKTVSFNKKVGERTALNGFREAKIIVGGKYEQGYGGGVCQVSTTVYNAALLADMEIVSANQHSLKVGYIEPSFDAMVNSSWSDLKFCNKSGRNIYIHSYATTSRVIIEFFGVNMPYRITRHARIISRIPHSGSDRIFDVEGKYSEHVKYKGQSYIASHPKDGLVSEGYLRYHIGAKLLKEVKIRNDKYSPQRGLIVEGVLDPPPVIIPETPIEDKRDFQFFLPRIFSKGH